MTIEVSVFLRPKRLNGGHLIGRIQLHFVYISPRIGFYRLSHVKDRLFTIRSEIKSRNVRRVKSLMFVLSHSVQYIFSTICNRSGVGREVRGWMEEKFKIDIFFLFFLNICED